jgi:hypothetical protein
MIHLTVLPGSLLSVLVIALFAPVLGRVVDTAGQPLKGVTVVGIVLGSRDEIITDSNGQWALADSQRFIRFSLKGYRPVTKQVGADDVSLVVMQQDPSATWSLPFCKGRVSVRGGVMGATTHRGVSIGIVRGSIHASDFSGTYRGQRLIWGWGETWSSVPSRLLGSLTNVQDRDLERNGLIIGSDYRGIRKDGKHSREVTIGVESISYDGITEDAMRVFDQMIDSLCWLPNK